MRRSRQVVLGSTFLHLRRNSKPADLYSRFKFIARFRRYTRAYHVVNSGSTSVVGKLLAPHLVNYT